MLAFVIRPKERGLPDNRKFRPAKLVAPIERRLRSKHLKRMTAMEERLDCLLMAYSVEKVGFKK